MQGNHSTSTAQPQPKRITGIPYAWGLEDGAKGKSVYTGYHLFAGAKLTEYKRGWAEGKRLRKQ